MFLVEAKYVSDAERKRIEYIADKWGDKVRRPNGYILMMDDLVAKDVVKELASKIFPNEVKAYRLEPVGIEISQTVESVTTKVEASEKTVKSFLGYLLAKRRALFKRELINAEVYEIYTRKGVVELRLTIKGNDQTKVVLAFNGPSEAVEYLMSEFKRELETFKEGV